MLEAVPESDEDVRDDFSSDDGETKGIELKHMDKMANTQERFKKDKEIIDDELQHLESLKLVGDLVSTQRELIDKNNEVEEMDQEKMFDTLTKMNAQVIHRLSISSNIEPGQLEKEDINKM